MVDRTRAAPIPSSTPARWLVVPVVLALLLTQLPAVAFADHGGRDIGSVLNCDRPVTPPRCTSVGDDLRHRVVFDESLSAGLATALRGTMLEDYGAPTRLVLLEEPEVTPLTDVIAFSGDFGDNGAAAWVYCPSDAPQGVNAAGDRWCRQQELYFNLNPRYGIFFDDDASRAHVACHELGHTVGLRHWGNPPQTDGPSGATCMNANTPNGPTGLHQTDIDHINAYPYRVRLRAPAFHLVHTPEGPATAAGGSGAGAVVGASEVELPRSLDDLAGRADLVVHGRVTAVEPGRVFGPPSQPLHYAAVTVAVRERLAGVAGAAPAEIVLEVPLLDGPESLDSVRGRMLGTERILFLRNKGVSAAAAGLPLADRLAESGFHRLVTFGSEIVEVGGVAVAAPDESAALEPFTGLPFEEVIARLRELARAER